MVVAIENFFGCYLLFCTNPKFKGRTYIGYTVNPKRRIKQHNAGKHKGGAWKTSGRGPWDMVLIIHGFPSDISALRFEWAWQNPDRSRRLKFVGAKLRKESNFQFRIRVLSNMLCQTPWKKLPLTVRWLKQEYTVDLDPVPPSHMPIAYGPVTCSISKIKDKQVLIGSQQQEHDDATASTDSSDGECVSLVNRLIAKSKALHQPLDEKIGKTLRSTTACFICLSNVSNEKPINCIFPKCSMSSHMTCLAKHFLAHEQPFQLLPVDGNCPKCKQPLVWGDLIRDSQGFHQHLQSDLT